MHEASASRPSVPTRAANGRLPHLSHVLLGIPASQLTPASWDWLLAHDCPTPCLVIAAGWYRQDELIGGA